MLAALLLWSALGYFDRARLAPVTIGAIYWYFVNAAWLAVFFTFCITPYLVELSHGRPQRKPRRRPSRTAPRPGQNRLSTCSAWSARRSPGACSSS